MVKHAKGEKIFFAFDSCRKSHAYKTPSPPPQASKCVTNLFRDTISRSGEEMNTSCNVVVAVVNLVAGVKPGNQRHDHILHSLPGALFLLYEGTYLFKFSLWSRCIQLNVSAQTPLACLTGESSWEIVRKRESSFFSIHPRRSFHQIRND